MVREYLLGRLDEAQVRALHERAAAYYGAPFVEAARRGPVVHAQSAPRTATDESRSKRWPAATSGVVGAWTHQTQDMDRARWAMERALAWQEHLFQAGRFDAAGDIVTAVCACWRAGGSATWPRRLLRRSIETLEGTNRAVAQGNLATMLQDEGRLAEALATYERVYETFAALEAKQQMAGVLSQMGQRVSGDGRVRPGHRKGRGVPAN